MGLLDKLTSYGGNWTLVSKNKLTKGEIKNIKSATVLNSPAGYGNSLCFTMINGAKKFVPLAKDSYLKEGQSVDLQSVTILTLSKEGEGIIYRADGDPQDM